MLDMSGGIGQVFVLSITPKNAHRKPCEAKCAPSKPMATDEFTKMTTNTHRDGDPKRSAYFERTKIK